MIYVARQNIVYHSLRLNLQNEQHHRVHLVLANLNTDVHKSVNQFLINAVDAYVNGSKDSVTQRSGGNPDKHYVVKEELDALRKEIKDELKTEMIVILGSIVTNGAVRQVAAVAPNTQEESSENYGSSEMEGLVGMWG